MVWKRLKEVGMHPRRSLIGSWFLPQYRRLVNFAGEHEAWIVQQSSRSSPDFLLPHQMNIQKIDFHGSLFAAFIKENFTFTACCIQQCLNEANIHQMKWPVRSPDLNPIEHMRYIFWRRLGAMENKNDLWATILEEWKQIPQKK